MKRIALLSFAVLVSFWLPFSSSQADVQVLADKCEQCHGKDGNSNDGKVPNIAGMSVIYLTDTLNAYLSGDRKGVKYTPKEGDESDMEEVTKQLSAEDIDTLAKHYASKHFVVHVQEVDAAMAARGKKLFKKKCEKCHSESGSEADDDAGILLGQWRPYIKKQFTLFSDGTRIIPKKMKKKFAKLNHEEKADIIEFLASGQQ